MPKLSQDLRLVLMDAELPSFIKEELDRETIAKIIAAAQTEDPILDKSNDTR